MSLTLQEMETHFNMSADNRATWHVYSDDPVMMRRLESVGATFVRGDSFGGKHYTLRADQILIRKGKRALSEDTRVQLAERLRALRPTPSTTETEQANRA